MSVADWRSALGRGARRRAHSLLLIIGCLLSTAASATTPTTPDAAFEALKSSATPVELHRVLYALPKGGDLHNHASGSIHPDWLTDLAVASEARGYRYFVKTRINNCRSGGNEFGAEKYLLLYRVIPEFVLAQLDECERGEYVPLLDIDAETRRAWERALHLDKPHEGRAEFFEAQWTRLNGLLVDPHLSADALVLNMQSFGREGLHYLEPQIPLFHFRTPTGEPISPEAALAVYRQRLQDSDARASGVTVRFQTSVLRFPANAEAALREAYAFSAAAPDVLAVNLVGREDNDKGYPLRFLPTLRELRRTHGALDLSIHAGEVDEPNSHVRDTLLLGARRIGHGLNLIYDADTMRLMRHGPYLVEINLISNLLLEYVKDYSQHPFPEYLRTGIPVALSTDDRGMWDSTMTDEFFVAVTEFDLSWAEVRRLIENSISFGFVEAPVKKRLLETVQRKLQRFERALVRGSRFSDVTPEYRGFVCRRYSVCASSSG